MTRNNAEQRLFEYLQSRQNEKWEYEKDTLKIVMNTVPDFTLSMPNGKQIVLELKGQAPGHARAKMQATNATFISNRVFLSSRFPDDLVAELEAVLNKARARGVRVDMTRYPETVYIVAPFVNKVQRGRFMDTSYTDVRAGYSLVDWCTSNCIVNAPVSYTDFSVLEEALNKYKQVLDK